MRTLSPTLGLMVLATSCASWDETREQLVDPIASLVHVQYPTAIRTRDADSYVALHSPEQAAAAHAEAQRVFADWAEIANATCILHTVALERSDQVVVDATLRIDGIDARGQRRTDQRGQQIICRRGDDGSWRIVSTDSGETRSATGVGPTFTDEAEQRGLVCVQASHGVKDREGVVRKYLAGSGLAVGDLTGNGFEDLVFINGREAKLFVNRDGQFAEEAQLHGILPWSEGEARCATVVDLDGDGRRDLFICRLGASNLYYHQNDDGTFRRFDSEEIGITSSGEATGACFADFDGDGDLDLYIVNGANLLLHHPDPIYDAKNGTANQLFLNDGHGHFQDFSAAAGVDDSGWGLACTASDYDSDGDVDLIAANDFGPDLVFRNHGDATFEDVSDEVGVVFRGSSMGVDTGDCDGDGDIDIFISGMASNSAWIIDQAGYPAPAPWPISMLFRGFVLDVIKEMFHGNRLYLNRGDGTFEEASVATGSSNAGWSWAGIFLDYDHDTDLDLYVLNGLISGQSREDC